MLAGVGLLSAAAATSVSAGAPPVLTVTPSTVTAGGTVTVSMNCYGDEVTMNRYRDGVDVPTAVPMTLGDDEMTYSGTVRLDADGATEDFDVVFQGECWGSYEDAIAVRVLVPAPTTTIPDPPVTVVPGPTTTAAPTPTPPVAAAPATAVPARPAYTG